MDESGGWLVGSATDVGISDKVVHCKHFGVLNVELLSTHALRPRTVGSGGASKHC